LYTIYGDSQTAPDSNQHEPQRQPL
jgi:hypothetical protein